MENYSQMVDARVNTGDIFNLFDCVEKMELDSSLAHITDTGYPGADGLDICSDMCFYSVEKLSYDKEYPRREAFENVLNSLDNEAFNFVYVLSGNNLGVELDIGVVKNYKPNKKTLSTVNYGEIIANSFEGNFGGSSLKRLDINMLNEKFIKQIKVYKSAGIISGIPSINESDSGEKFDFQGIDRLINSMLGQNWRIVVVCEPVSKAEVLGVRDDVYELYNRLSVYSKATIQKSVSSGDSVSLGRNVSNSHGKNKSWNESDSETKGKNSSSGTRSSSLQHQFGKSGGNSEENSEGKNWGYSQNRGTSEAVTIEMANKHTQDLMKYIDEELLPRIKEGYGKGMFKTTLFYMADKVTTASRLKLSIMSLFQGNKSNFSPLISKELNIRDGISLKALNSYQNVFYNIGEYSPDAARVLSKPMDFQFGLGASTYLTAREVSILAGLPQREVPGIVLNEAVDFGLNEHPVNEVDAIDIGVLVQKGRKLNIRFKLKKSSMTKHMFVAGVTGSGKTTTCHKLLAASETPFLVIEPAKTEYRTLAQEKNQKKYGDVYVFTLGNESVAPFRINPFELVEGEVLSAHIDMIKATFTSAFPMEASMPQILEEAIVKCYENKGWNIDTSTNSIYTDIFNKNEKDKQKRERDMESCFPIMSELLEQMKIIVKQKGFSAQMQADYEGSLVSRLSNLTVGAKGRMLNCPYSTDFRFIAYNKVILEMEELKSPEDKALFMGFILSRLSAVVKEEHKRDSSYRHLTLIEEAHRLLSKVDYGDSGSKKSAVETFTDLLAEVRKYGEGLIIVDQIPNKLAPDVLKNTNTKIIHKILARDDKEAVGDTVLMDEKQKEFLSALEPGHAIIFSENTEKPVHVYVERETDTNEDEIGTDVIKTQFCLNRQNYGTIYNDLEVVQYYDFYVSLAEQIRTRHLKMETINKFKMIVEDISKKSYFSSKDNPEKEVIKNFFSRRERMLGNDADKSVLEEVSEFLLELINKGNIDDLDFRKCRKFV